MAIFGKTDLASLESREVNVHIQVFKGDIKQGDRPGVNLKQELRIHIDTPWLREKINYAKDSYHQGIPVFLAYSTPDPTFPNFNKGYSLSGLETVCDGVNILKHCIKVTTQKGDYRKVVEATEEIPCAKFTKDGEELPECPRGCKGMGTLYFYLQEMQAVAPYQLASLTTVHSREVFSIAKQLLNYHREFGSLSLSPFPWSETFGKIPFILNRLSGKRKAPTFDKTTKKRTGTTNETADWPVTLTVEPLWYQRFLLWQQYVQAKECGVQLPPAVLRQLGFEDRDGSLLKSADAGVRALAPVPDEEESLKRELMRELGKRLKEQGKDSEWAREMAFQRYGATSTEGASVAAKLSIENLRDFLECLNVLETVEKEVEDSIYEAEVEAVEIETEEIEEVEPEPDNF